MILRDVLNKSLIERQEEVELMMLGLVARVNVLFIGEPGTAKSLMVDNLLRAISDAHGFSALMHKFLPPEEVMGPLKLSELQNDVYERAVDGYMPTCNVAFLDEIWKASPAILNTLLKILNEKKFRNGTTTLDVPMRMAVGASNEWPIGEGFQTTGALFDRFLIRTTVRPVSNGRRDDLLFGELPLPTPVISLAEIDQLAEDCVSIPFTVDAKAAYAEVIDELSRVEKIKAGDRRMRASVRIAQAAACLDGADRVEPQHLEPLKHTLWVHPDQQETCHKIVVRICDPTGADIAEIMAEADTLFEGIGELTDPVTLGNMKKLGSCVKKVQRIGGDKSKEAAKILGNRLTTVRVKLLGATTEEVELATTSSGR
jgi:MoxR-like ATPase